MTAEDRCDRCGARAHATAILPSGTLLFCGHHLSENRDALADAGAIVTEDSPTLTTPRLG